MRLRLAGGGWGFCRLGMWLVRQELDAANDLECVGRQVPSVAPREVIAYDESVKKRAIDLFKGKRILVVDDSRHFRNMTKKMLVVLDAVVDEAEDGNDALAKLADHAYDMMLLDLSMPGLDGYATAEKLRDGAIPGLENLAIVAHSSESPHAAKVRLERLGVNEFASKGCNPLELFNAMCRAHEASAAQTKNRKDLEIRVKPASKTILVADDEDFCRKFVRTVLLNKGFQVMDAPSGQIALGLLNDASVKIDAVITDIHMPGLDGYEIARTLRARPLPQGTMPVIALSAYCDDAMLSHAREAGISGFLTKPVSEIELLQALSQQLGGDSGVHDAPAAEVAEPATAASPRASLLLDAIKLEGLHRMGYVKEDFLLGLNEAHAKMEELAASVGANDMTRIKALLHALMGLSGTLGAQAVHEAMQARYVALLESGHCLIDKNELTRLRQLLVSTDREMQMHLMRKYAAT